MKTTPTLLAAVATLVAVTSLLTSPTQAFNITRLLDQHSDFSSFNTLLSQTGVAEAVNGRQTITVLALDNSAVGGVSGRSSDVTRAIIATHVVLDYYDATKLAALSKNKSAVLTTLYQSTGKANGMQGFLNVTVNQGQVVFGSAVKGAQHDCRLVKVVAAQPFNISVIQVSSVIIPPGIDQSSSSAPITAPPPRKMGPPPPASEPSSDSDTPSSSEPPAADDTKTPSKAPAAADSDAPASGPAAADDVADKEGKKKSGAARVSTSSGLFLAAVAVMAAL